VGNIKFLNFNIIIAPLFIALIFSPIGVFYLFSFGGSYFPEFGIILSLIIFKIRKASLSALYTEQLFVLLIFIFFNTLVGTLFGNTLIHIYSEVRCLIAILFGYLYFNYICVDKDFELHIFRIVIFALALFVFHTIYYYFIVEAYNVKKYFPMLGAWIIFICLQRLNLNNFNYLLLPFFLFISIVSLYRSNIVVIAFAILWVISCTIKKGVIKNAFFIGIISFILISVLYFIFPFVTEYYSLDESRLIHGLNKWIDLYNLLEYQDDAAESESIRLNYYIYLTQNVPYLMTPSGLGYFKGASSQFCHEFISCIDGSVRDNSLLYMVVSFGWVVTLFGVIYFLKLFFPMFFYLTRLGKFKLLLILISVIFLLNITAAFFGELSTAIMLGLFLGIINNYSKFFSNDFKIKLKGYEKQS